MCVSRCSPVSVVLCVCVSYAFRCLQKPEKCFGFPGAGVIGDCEPPAYWDLNSGPVQL